jgi:N-glycosylase/DNA lyase
MSLRARQHVKPLLHGVDAEVSVNSGQMFLWEKAGDSWYGIYGSRVIRFSRAAGALKFASFPEDKEMERRMFRLDDDIEFILAQVSADPLVGRLVRMYGGLRLLRQDPEQCLFSFVCASNTNIPMIRRMLYALAAKYGDSVRVDGKEFHAFPSAKALGRATEAELRACGLGYRARAVKAVAAAITSGALDLGSLVAASYDEARAELLKIYGVGPKIADCVLLFSLEKLDAFPIDVWIARALAANYQWMSGKFGEKLTSRQYEEASKAARRYFGPYAGYAQQYLYYHMRQGAGKKW